MGTVQSASVAYQMPLLVMSGDGQCNRLPHQELVLTGVTELKRIPWRLTLIAVLGEQHYCIGKFECHLVLADPLLQRQISAQRKAMALGK